MDAIRYITPTTKCFMWSPRRKFPISSLFSCLDIWVAHSKPWSQLDVFCPNSKFSLMEPANHFSAMERFLCWWVSYFWKSTASVLRSGKLCLVSVSKLANSNEIWVNCFISSLQFYKLYWRSPIHPNRSSSVWIPNSTRNSNSSSYWPNPSYFIFPEPKCVPRI